MFCVTCFPWLMESAKRIFLLSVSTVVQPAPHPTVLVINQTMCHHHMRRQHVFNVMPGRQGDRIPFMYCEDHSFERELNEWIP